MKLTSERLLDQPYTVMEGEEHISEKFVYACDLTFQKSSLNLKVCLYFNQLISEQYCL